ncbi:tryptophan synthase subunit alpha [Anaerosporobacter faecicola]|uniref:tryptophan synthase subunit alpha n=1 Tax=Anaerosporobacter faecicola TaxID=2718714 RepID=UPI00143BC4C8|nr:tryptophan synthase subunit alpha [Anaerosporobacter faecicola]
MSRIGKAFEKKKVFIGFVTAGDPSLDKTEEFILEMERAGAGLVEIGIPFSDPIAEGSVIQEANIRALNAGCTTDRVFDMVASLRQKTEIPLVFLTYLNPIFRYGKERFCKRCQAVGIDGLIIPDMPFEEKEELASITKEYGIKLVSMIAPTSGDRIEMIAKESEGFLYVVSSMGVTGVRNEIKTNVGEIVERIRRVTNTPVAIGFGIHTKEQVKEYCTLADGIIIGSAITKLIARYGEDAGKEIYTYVNERQQFCS